MNHSIKEPDVRSYLADLEVRLAHLPGEQSEEILFGVREHIAEAMDRGGQSTAEILAGLGSPDDIAAGVAAPDVPAQQGKAQTPVRTPLLESSLWVALTTILLAFGGFLYIVGWFVGLAGLWMGTRWKIWEKIMGTVLFPGGVLGSIYIATLPVRSTLTSGTVPTDPVLDTFLPAAATIAFMCLPLLVNVYLLVVGLRRGPKKA